ncbi:hypothetical protein [Nocardia brasiliensis]|uniref:hypothetical protein n=1 Tax=Nocardia brasiliensis TaxID=37326 RepID=UPI0036719D1D
MASPTYRDDWVDGLIDKGRAEGRAEEGVQMLLRVLAARGFHVPEQLRARIESCRDTDELERWVDRAVAASSIEAVFGD